VESTCVVDDARESVAQRRTMGVDGKRRRSCGVGQPRSAQRTPRLEEDTR
jgi:hypothetical protein